jgi:hypothetical protein
LLLPSLWLPGQALREEEEEEEEMKLSRRKEEAKRNVQRARERGEGGGISPICKRAKGSEISKQPKGLLQDR